MSAGVQSHPLHFFCRRNLRIKSVSGNTYAQASADVQVFWKSMGPMSSGWCLGGWIVVIDGDLKIIAREQVCLDIPHQPPTS